MQQKKLHELLNVISNLASIAEVGAFSHEDYRGNTTPLKAFGCDPALIFHGYDKVKQLEEAVERFWISNDEVYQTISKATVESKVVHLAFDTCQNEEPLTESDIEQMFSKLLTIPKQEWEVFRPLYGARLSTKAPIELGPFTVYNWELHQSLIAKKHPAKKVLWGKALKDALTDLLVSIKISNRNESRSEEFADIRFRQFVNVVRYMIADKEGGIDVGIFDYRSWNSFKSFSLSKTNAATSVRTEGAYQRVDIDNPFFIGSSAGHTWIWDTLSQPNLCDMQKRVIAAIEWVGKGLRDPDPTKAFVQFVFAIEALLTFQEKNVLVSPSIASQLAEYSAFILGSDYDSRLQVEKSIKKLYGHRSAVAHGGSQSVLESEVNDALWLVRSLVTRMITEPELLAMRSIEQLQKWVSKQKYS